MSANKRQVSLGERPVFLFYYDEPGNLSREENRILLDSEEKSVSIFFEGRLAQLARAPARHAGGQRFESFIAHFL